MRRSIYSAAAAVVGLGLVAAILWATGVIRQGGAVSCSKLASNGPLIDGRKTTIAGAQSAVRFPVLIPSLQRLAGPTSRRPGPMTGAMSR